MNGQIVFNEPINYEHEKLEEMVGRSKRVLMTVRSRKPFDLFPDFLIIDENKISLVHREFGLTDIHIVFIENVSYVTINTNLISATLNITDSTSERFPVMLSIDWLNKQEAVRARELIHGLMVAKKSSIQFEKFDKDELIKELEQLGEVKGLPN